MKIEKIDELNKNIKVAIPLTGQTSKTRVKSRDIWYGYGYPVATRQKEFNNIFLSIINFMFSKIYNYYTAANFTK